MKKDIRNDAAKGDERSHLKSLEIHNFRRVVVVGWGGGGGVTNLQINFKKQINKTNKKSNQTFAPVLTPPQQPLQHGQRTLCSLSYFSTTVMVARTNKSHNSNTPTQSQSSHIQLLQTKTHSSLAQPTSPQQPQ